MPDFIAGLLAAAFVLVFLLCIIIILTSLLVLVNEINGTRFVDRLIACRDVNERAEISTRAKALTNYQT